MNIYLTLQYLATSSLQLAQHRFSSSWEWYVIRAAGFVAAGLLILLMLSGIGHVTGLTYRFVSPVKAWAIHKAMGIALLASVIVHVLFVLLDKYIPFSFAQAFVPFQSHYNNGTTFAGMALGGLAITFGIIAAYGITLVVLSSLGWIDTKPGRWRSLHYVSYLVVAMVFLHGLYTGSDLKYGVFRSFWILAGLVLLLAIVSRVTRTARTKNNDSDNNPRIVQ